MKRRGYARYDKDIDLAVTPLTIRGYGTNQEFVCRILISGAGLEVWAGPTGKQRVADLTWEELVRKLRNPTS